MDFTFPFDDLLNRRLSLEALPTLQSIKTGVLTFEVRADLPFHCPGNNLPYPRKYSHQSPKRKK